jgi:hypothetical protein
VQEICSCSVLPRVRGILPHLKLPHSPRGKRLQHAQSDFRRERILTATKFGFLVRPYRGSRKKTLPGGITASVHEE